MDPVRLFADILEHYPKLQRIKIYLSMKTGKCPSKADEDQRDAFDSWKRSKMFVPKFSEIEDLLD